MSYPCITLHFIWQTLLSKAMCNKWGLIEQIENTGQIRCNSDKVSYP
uniref:Uncharacterized protein n=1 Tax=Anguilla anguilla TaxID=7936 RepID=A0A0E9SRP3_ANGAN